MMNYGRKEYKNERNFNTTDTGFIRFYYQI